jgi:hypothetical protein
VPPRLYESWGNSQLSKQPNVTPLLTYITGFTGVAPLPSGKRSLLELAHCRKTALTRFWHRVIHNNLITALNAQREEWRLAQGLHPQRVQMIQAFDTIVVNAQMNNIAEHAKKVSLFRSTPLRQA